MDARQNEVALAATTIRAMSTGLFKVEEVFLAALIDDGVSIETARERIMTKLDADFQKHPTIPINPAATFGGRDEVDKRREGMESALFLRANPGAPREI